MAEQLTILGLWERTAPGEKVEEEALPPPLPAPVVDPRQHELLAGAHTLRATLEDSCARLDAAALRAAHAELTTQYGGQGWAEHAPAWAERIEWLVEDVSATEGARRALELRADEHLAGMRPLLFESVRSAAPTRAARRLTDEGGAAAALSDGRPAGYLALLSADFVLARELLVAACEAQSPARAQWLGYAGEAAWRLGDSFNALQAYCRASLIDPHAIDQETLTCRPVIELLDLSDELELSDEPLSYLAVLADLSGKHALDDVLVETTDPQRLAALLRRFRRARADGLIDEAGRIAAKRELARLSPPGLRELLRRL